MYQSKGLFDFIADFFWLCMLDYSHCNLGILAKVLDHIQLCRLSFGSLVGKHKSKTQLWQIDVQRYTDCLVTFD